MSKSKKYDFRIIPGINSWSAEIIRRINSQKTMISKRQNGFTSESEAQAWGETELKAFTENQSARNKRHSVQRAAQHAKHERAKNAGQND